MDTIRLTLQICLAYCYLRLVYELLQAGVSSVSLPHLVGLIVGAHGVWFWHSRQTAGNLSGVAGNANVLLFFVVILAIASLADAGTLLLRM